MNGCDYYMKIGSLNKAITIQKSTSYIDEHGVTKNKWVDYKTVWSNINNLFGKEFWEAKQLNMENTVVFTIRYSIDFIEMTSNQYRIKWDEKIYNITFIDNVQYSNTWLKIKAVEVIK